MHTDEYEIALSREVGVCKSHVRNYQRVLDKMETRYGMTSAAFRERYGSAPSSKDNPEFRTWFKACEAINTWEARLREYENAYRLMKI